MKNAYIKLAGVGKAIIINGNSITSAGLKQVCPYCSQETCYADCDGAAGDIDGLESEEQMEMRRLYNFAVDGLESYLLALSMAGVDVSTDAFKEALQTTLDAIANNVENA